MSVIGIFRQLSKILVRFWWRILKARRCGRMLPDFPHEVRELQAASG